MTTPPTPAESPPLSEKLEAWSYLQGYTDASKPHPRMAQTGTEARCILCGLDESPLHDLPCQKEPRPQ